MAPRAAGEGRPADGLSTMVKNRTRRAIERPAAGTPPR